VVLHRISILKHVVHRGPLIQRTLHPESAYWLCLDGQKRGEHFALQIKHDIKATDSSTWITYIFQHGDSGLRNSCVEKFWLVKQCEQILNIHIERFPYWYHFPQLPVCVINMGLDVVWMFWSPYQFRANEKGCLQNWIFLACKTN